MKKRVFKPSHILFYLILLIPLMGLVWRYNPFLPSSPKKIIIYIVPIFGLFLILTKKKIFFPNYLYLMVFYIVYISIIDIQYNEFVNGNFLRLLQKNSDFLSIIILLVLIENTVVNKSFYIISLRFIQLLLVLTTIGSIIQLFHPSFLKVNGEEQITTAISIYTNRRYSIFSLEGANSLVLSYLPMAAIFLSYSIKENKLLKTIFFLFLIGITGILSNSRTTMLGFAILLIYFLYSERKIIRLNKLLFFLPLVLLGLFYIISEFGYDLNSFIENRISQNMEESARVVTYQAFKEVFPDYLFFGLGNENSPIIHAALKGRSPNMHVGYLRHLVTYGSLGSFFLFAFWISLSRRLYKSAKATKMWGSFIAFSIFLLANLFFTVYSMFYVGLILSLIFDKIYRDQFSNNHNNWINPKM